MSQLDIPCLLMRGGTSKGPYFNSSDLPSDREEIAKILIAALGAGHALNIDGVGGGNPVTTKVAILSSSDDEWAEIDYLFAQVNVEEHTEFVRMDNNPLEVSLFLHLLCVNKLLGR